MKKKNKKVVKKAKKLRKKVVKKVKKSKPKSGKKKNIKAQKLSYAEKKAENLDRLSNLLIEKGFHLKTQYFF